MNEKITLPKLIQQLALKSGESRKLTEDFIKEFFSVISTSLKEGEQVKVKSLGVFKTVSVGARKSVNVSTGEEHEIPPHYKVVFTPNKEVASVINEPFEMFETIEVNDDADLEDLDESGLNKVSSVNSDNEEEDTPDIESSVNVEILELPNGNEGDNSKEESKIENKDLDLSEHNDAIDDNSNQIPDNVVESEVSEESEELLNKTNKRFGIGFASGFISAAVICGILFAILYFSNYKIGFTNNSNSSFDNQISLIQSKDSNVETDQPAKEEAKLTEEQTKPDESGISKEQKENTISVPTEPSDAPVYDMITETRYLTTMAKDHYGNYHLWPYIYMENSQFLGHPDRIKPGTKILIPSLSKYGVDPKNKKDIEIAKKKGIEIYSKYQ